MEALDAGGTHPFGMIALSQGYLLTSIILASTMVHITDRRFGKWSPRHGAASSVLLDPGRRRHYRSSADRAEPC